MAISHRNLYKLYYMIIPKAFFIIIKLIVGQTLIYEKTFPFSSKPKLKQCSSNISVCGRNPVSSTIQMKAIEQYFHVVLFTMLYQVACIIL